MNLLPDAERWRRIVRLGLPIMGGISTYALLELIDIVFIGYLGTVQLAAAGISVFLTFSYLSMFGGVSIAVQSTTARLVGERESRDLARFLRATLAFVLVTTPLGALLLGLRASDLLGLMSDDAAVVAAGTAYLRWSFAAGVFFTINNAFMGYWNATDRPNLYFRVVIAQAAVKLPLNYLLVFGGGPVPAFGIDGAGMSTCAAAVAGTLYHAATGLRHAPDYWRIGTMARWRHVTIVVRLLVPAGAQQFLENLALTLMFRIVALIGTIEVAGYTVLVNLISVVGLPAWGLGMAGATLVGQSMGAGDAAAAHRWAWDVAKIGTLAMIVLGVPFWAMPEVILGLFLHDAVALEVAIWPCRVMGLMIGINGLGYLFASLLYGAGDVKRVMYVNVATQYLVLLPGAYLVGVHWAFGLIGVWLVHQIAFRAVNAAILTALWQQRRWARVRLW